MYGFRVPFGVGWGQGASFRGVVQVGMMTGFKAGWSGGIGLQAAGGGGVAGAEGVGRVRWGGATHTVAAGRRVCGVLVHGVKRGDCDGVARWC